MFKSKTTQKKVKLIINKIKKSSGWQGCVLLSSILLLSSSYAVYAQDTPVDLQKVTGELKVGLDTLWVVLASVLVIFMNAGFAMLETGFCRRKNAVNMLSKNLMVFAVSTIAFWAIGFGLMFSDGNGFIGLQGFFLKGADNSPALGDAYEGVYNALNWTGVPLSAKFLFQVAFAGTAATIVSGAVAERIKFIDFLLFAFFLVAIAYPMIGHWVWGGGWLQKAGFQDFAGSTVVHSVGGWCALTGAIILGARLGKYQEDGSIIPLPGHNLSVATLGCFILWIGWFGFNPGSTMAVNDSIANIAVVTNLAAASGGITGTVTSWILAGKPDLSLSINGILSGLVAITAGCSMVSNSSAITIGALAGILVVFAVYLLDSLKIDDPVGAVSVHLVNGIWGTLAVGLFADATITGNEKIAGLFSNGNFALLGIQLLGVVTVGMTMIILSVLFWNLLRVTLGLRVSPEEEYLGLDIGEHGMEAYNGFLEVDN
ncbi:MAG: ammonium transporter [Cyanobacteria bacterium]|nr:ammonium transporter [Cyanobacteria bacterium CG_2015-16_32_12]NCO79328.1 ammonium transporter [Cyanobacteria bacterium CG_2015-22_32_23]NCQ05024.1 ammonium transporter [Cyanobacteria bacterium CG_2015-09_32_10]NCQ41352.1 ammonium transporter [Cyanobacteria bacterium CG_2015-04_32_10]NCS84546.1 ammonium transporter [Cyanobacteria bacterium CG_2015-02_32_10]